MINDALADPRTAGNPLVHGEMGVRFYAAAPITTWDGHHLGTHLGTVNVLDTEPRQITEAGLATLTDLAAVVMDQLELRLSALNTVRTERALRTQAEHDRAKIERDKATIEQDKATIQTFASTLQRTLLPPALPRVPGLELASHYHPASSRDVGGDFYDVFPLPGDRWVFFLGDVCGHGAPAAALTSLTRYTLRAAAWHNSPPGQRARGAERGTAQRTRNRSPDRDGDVRNPATRPRRPGVPDHPRYRRARAGDVDARRDRRPRWRRRGGLPRRGDAPRCCRRRTVQRVQRALGSG